MLKLRDKGTKLVFDDEGQAHPIYELENEDQFKQRGPADAQKALFLQAEQDRLLDADVRDKEAAKLKKKEKRAKRKAREAEERGEGQGEREVVLVPYEGDEGDVGGDDMASEEEQDEVYEPETKRPKKWFEDDSQDEGKFKRKRKERSPEPDTLEDLEAVAAGLLG